jgi:hypothetical protein
LFTMVRNVFSDHLCRYFVANCSDKVSIFPEFTTPKLPFHFRMLLEYYAGTDALQHPYHFGDRVPRWKGQKDMDMVFCNLKGVYLEIVSGGYLFKDLFRSLSEISTQDPLSIFRGPHQMIFRIIDRMAGSLQFHAICIAYLSLPSAGELFIPVYKTGYSSSVFA